MSDSPPSAPLSADDLAVVERFESADQGHVFRFLDRLDGPSRRALIDQAAGMDLDLVARLRPLVSADATAEGELAPPSVVRPSEMDMGARSQARQVGEALLARGAVAAVLVAGGQGTRLGFDGPKGAFPIGPVTDRTLFDWFAARLSALDARHGRPVPLYIMTSETTHAPTVAFFEERDHLGLAASDVRFFQQGMVPALDADGRLILETPSRIFLGPNGHGGVFEALASSGSLADMADRGIEEIFYFQVDNVLARVADPLFLGLHRRAGAQMSSKVVDKAGPDEKVGIVAYRGGRLCVVEYSEMSREQMDARDDDGRLVYSAGNIAIHAIRRDFAERVASSEDLPYHCARKAVPYVDEQGQTVKPDTPNATKFERFVFDALPLTESSVTMDVPRAEEFAPVKNATGVDSPDTARAALTAQFRRWYDEVGLAVGGTDQDGVEMSLEIDPCFALDAEALRERAAEVEE
jgi:UDP-N-acetylglucosamine pyrophosphorylase